MITENNKQHINCMLDKYAELVLNRKLTRIERSLFWMHNLSKIEAILEHASNDVNRRVADFIGGLVK